MLGDMYLYGQGTIQNLNLAINSYKKCIANITIFQRSYACSTSLACKNSMLKMITSTLNNLGLAYEISLNYKEAFSYYRQAANLGLALSQFNLARMYFDGHGTIQNDKEAYAWVSVAVASGLSDATRQKIAENLKSTIHTKFFIFEGGEKMQAPINNANELAKKYYNLYVLKQAPTQQPSNSIK
jgi:TPR repeat protein